MTSGALSRPVKSLIETIIGASGFTNVTVFGSKVAGGVGNGGKTGALVVDVGVGVGDAEVLAGVGEELVAAGVGDEVGEDVGEAVVLVGDGEAVGELNGEGEVVEVGDEVGDDVVVGEVVGEAEVVVVGEDVGDEVGEAVVLVGDGEAVGEAVVRVGEGDGDAVVLVGDGDAVGELNGDGEEVGVPLPGQVCDKRIPESEPRIVA